MKIGYCEISALQKGETKGPFILNSADVQVARSSISNYKNKWVGAEFCTRKEPFSVEQPDGKVEEIPGWCKLYITRLSFGKNIRTNENETVTCSVDE